MERGLARMEQRRFQVRPERRVN